MLFTEEKSYVGVQAPQSLLHDPYSSMNFPLPNYMLVRALQLVTQKEHAFMTRMNTNS